MTLATRISLALAAVFLVLALWYRRDAELAREAGRVVARAAFDAANASLAWKNVALSQPPALTFTTTSRQRMPVRTVATPLTRDIVRPRETEAKLAAEEATRP